MRKSTLYKTFDPTENDDKKIAVMIVAFFSYNLLTLLLNTLVNFIIPNTPLDTAVCMAVYLGIILFVIPPVSRRLSMVSVLLALLFVVVFLSHSIIYVDNANMILSLLPTYVIKVLPLFLLGYSIRNYELVLSYLEKASHYMIIVAFSYYVILYIAKLDFVSDNMSFAYYLLPFTVISIHSLIEKFTIPNLVSTIIALITHLLTGTRGPFICIAVSMLLFAFFNKNKDTRKIITTIVFALIVGFMFTDTFSEMLVRLNDFLRRNNIDNRIIQKFLDDELLSSSGRDVIMNTLKQAIIDKPLIGYGIAGERPLVRTYSHSIVYDLVLHFGVVIGLGLFILLCIAIIKSILVTNLNRSHKTVLLFMISCSFVKLFVSGTYINEPNFFLLIGMLLSVSNVKRHNGLNI